MCSNAKAPGHCDSFTVVEYRRVHRICELPLERDRNFVSSLFEVVKLPLSYPSFDALDGQLERLGVGAPQCGGASGPMRKMRTMAISSAKLGHFNHNR